MFYDKGRSLNVQAICHKVCYCAIELARVKLIWFFFLIPASHNLKHPTPYFFLL